MELINHFEKNKIINNDCFNILPLIPDKSIDMIFADLPYGTTQAKWDSILPMDRLWHEYNRIIKPNGVIIFTATQPFSSVIIMSNLDGYKYSWIWEKSKATNYLNAKKQPLRAFEEVLVFYKKQPTYNPQMTEGDPYFKGTALRTTEVYGSQKVTTVENLSGLRYPRNVIYFKTAESEGDTIHPTQKPISLLEYMIKTYTNEGDTVLDNVAGSFTTAIAAQKNNRNWICVELDTEYCKLGLERYNKYFNK
jgi:DNA modification methylase